MVEGRDQRPGFTGPRRILGRQPANARTLKAEGPLGAVRCADQVRSVRGVLHESHAGGRAYVKWIFKKYLADFKNWTEGGFSRARAEREHHDSGFPDVPNASMLDILNTDFKNYRGGVFSVPTPIMESSTRSRGTI